MRIGTETSVSFAGCTEARSVGTSESKKLKREADEARGSRCPIHHPLGFLAIAFYRIQRPSLDSRLMRPFHGPLSTASEELAITVFFSRPCEVVGEEVEEARIGEEEAAGTSLTRREHVSEHFTRSSQQAPGP